MHPLLGTWPTTQACALTGNQTSNLLVVSLHSIHWATPAGADSLNNIFFCSLFYYENIDIIHITYKVGFDLLFMLSVGFLVNGRLLLSFVGVNSYTQIFSFAGQESVLLTLQGSTVLDLFHSHSTMLLDINFKFLRYHQTLLWTFPFVLLVSSSVVI